MKTGKFKEFLLILLWILAAYAFFRGIEFYFETTPLAVWALVSLGLSLWLLIHHPLQRLRLPQALEIGTAVLLIGVFLLHFGFAVVGPRIQADNEDSLPCGPRSFESKCYNLSTTACSSAWEHYETECRAEAKATQLRPTQLIGAGVKKCVQRKFNQYMSYNQKRTEIEICQDYFKGLSN